MTISTNINNAARAAKQSNKTTNINWFSDKVSFYDKPTMGHGYGGPFGTTMFKYPRPDETPWGKVCRERAEGHPKYLGGGYRETPTEPMIVIQGDNRGKAYIPRPDGRAKSETAKDRHYCSN